MPREVLKDYIIKLDDTKNRLLLDSFEKEQYNLLLRRASINDKYLPIIKHLCINASIFKIEVNACGKSNKTALAYAVECRSIAIIDYLLKQEKVEVDPLLHIAIIVDFNVELIQKNKPKFISLNNELFRLKEEGIVLTRVYSEIDQPKIKTDFDSFISTLETLTMVDNHEALKENFQRFISNLHQLYIFQYQTIEPLYINYNLYKEALLKFLPYSYFYGKLFSDHEYNPNNLSKSLKATCLENRACFEENAKLIDHNIRCFENEIEIMTELFYKSLQIYHIYLKKYELRKNSLTSVEEKPFEASPLNSETKALEEDVIVSNPVQGIRLQTTPLSIKQKPKTPKCQTKSKRKNLPSKKRTFQTTEQRQQKLEEEAAALRVTIMNLEEHLSEIKELKETGTIKILKFQKILNDIAQNMGGVIKKTKNGFKLYYREFGIFTCHTSHNGKNGKGVDPAALNELSHMLRVKKENSEQQLDNLNRLF